MELRICRTCGIEKSIEEYPWKFQYNKKYYFLDCKPCWNSKLREDDRRKERAAKRMRDHRKENPDIYRGYEYKKKYKITLDVFNKILEEQGGVCAICGGTNKDRALAIDHDHNCCAGEVTCGNCLRALLCSNCNAGLGWFKHDIKIMQSAIRYMQEVKARPWS